MTRADLEKALSLVLESPNELDSNGEIANVVDGLFSISRSLRAIAAAQLITALMKETSALAPSFLTITERQSAIVGLLNKYWTLEKP